MGIKSLFDSIPSDFCTSFEVQSKYYSEARRDVFVFRNEQQMENSRSNEITIRRPVFSEASLNIHAMWCNVYVFTFLRVECWSELRPLTKLVQAECENSVLQCE